MLNLNKRALGLHLSLFIMITTNRPIAELGSDGVNNKIQLIQNHSMYHLCILYSICMSHDIRNLRIRNQLINFIFLKPNNHLQVLRLGIIQVTEKYIVDILPNCESIWKTIFVK